MDIRSFFGKPAAGASKAASAPAKVRARRAGVPAGARCRASSAHLAPALDRVPQSRPLLPQRSAVHTRRMPGVKFSVCDTSLACSAAQAVDASAFFAGKAAPAPAAASKDKAQPEGKT